MANEPLDKASVEPPVTIRLLTESDVPVSSVTVMPLVLIWASSDEVGTW